MATKQLDKDYDGTLARARARARARELGPELVWG